VIERDDDLQALIDRYVRLDRARKAVLRRLMGAQWAGVEEARARKQEVAEFMAGLPTTRAAAMRTWADLSAGDLGARRARHRVPARV